MFRLCSVGLTARLAPPDGAGSAVDGICRHALVVLEESGAVKPNIPKAEVVTFEEGAGCRAEAVRDTACLGDADVAAIKKLERGSLADGVGLLYRLGETETFAVRHTGDRSIPAGWAHVETRDMARPVGSQPRPARSRRSTVNANIQCKVFPLFLSVVRTKMKTPCGNLYASLIGVRA